jgi:hypothetical protein
MPICRRQELCTECRYSSCLFTTRHHQEILQMSNKEVEKLVPTCMVQPAPRSSLNQEEGKDEFFNRMAEEAITSDNLRDFNNNNINPYHASDVFMDFHETMISEIQNRMEFAEPIPTNSKTTLAQGETPSKATRSSNQPLPNLSSLDELIPLQQNSQETTIDDNWDKIDSVTSTGPLENMINLYDINENQEPSFSKNKNTSNNKNNPTVWMVADDITQQIQDQNKIKNNPTDPNVTKISNIKEVTTGGSARRNG